MRKDFPFSAPCFDDKIIVDEFQNLSGFSDLKIRGKKASDAAVNNFE